MLNSRRSVLFMAAGACGSGAMASAAPPTSLQARNERLRGAVPDIHEAAAAGQTARVEEILALNPGSVNHRDLQGATPLHYAAAGGQVALANLLLAKGAGLSIQAPGLDNATPAHFAADFDDPQVASQLAQTIVGNGADVHAKKADGTTPLDIARRRGNGALEAFLIRKAGGDCYTGRYRGVTRDDTYGIPQAWVNEFVTFSHFDLDKVKHLHGQCPDLLMTRSTWDEIGVEAAAHMGREDIAHFFLDNGSPLSLCTATMLGLTGEAKKILAEDGNRVRERGAHDFPLLWYTVFGQEHADLAELLITAGADPHAGMMGHTTLDLARKKGHNQVIEVLRKHGA
jgi:hypothetical protein